MVQEGPGRPAQRLDPASYKYSNVQSGRRSASHLGAAGPGAANVAGIVPPLPNMHTVGLKPGASFQHEGQTPSLQGIRRPQGGGKAVGLTVT